eukprot:TRINITY_DN3848_c0_g6_i2.p2 TRINITY_DN3848_c0_g6~~TRINITY_DN3848_c0_g6_i2.p2  ORF type:complete len:549 (+),score=234.38 TRINITY_DN3848_c0_g6_i2:160-1806(+)
MSILGASAVDKNFGALAALSQVDLTLNRGEVLGVIGPNGSGKTTLANLVTGFVKPSRGKVIFDGKDITGLPPYKVADLGIARSFQMVKPFYQLPAFKNLNVALLSPRLRRLSGGRFGDRDAVAKDLLEEVGFERDSWVITHQAASLPHGYLKRLELAKCMALQPEIIVLDELFSGLSLAEVASMVPVIEKLVAQGKTLLMIEHRLKELFRIADRVIVLNFGQKIAEGVPAEVMEDPQVRGAYLGSEAEEQAVLNVKDLIVFYENAIAVNDLSMEVREGQIVGVIGSNSAGKTTLMNTLSGLIWDMLIKEQRKGGERITVLGTVTWFGEDISRLPAYRRAQQGIVLCRERHPIFPDSSVVENLKIAGYLRSRAEVAKGIELSFELFPNLARHRRRKAGFLSGGEQQMLAIGRGLMGNPSIMLLDEPSQGLSPILVAKVASIVSDLCTQHGITLLLVEQNFRIALAMANRHYLMGTKSKLQGEVSSQQIMEDQELIKRTLAVQPGCRFEAGQHGATKQYWGNLKKHRGQQSEVYAKARHSQPPAGKASGK